MLFRFVIFAVSVPLCKRRQTLAHHVGFNLNEIERGIFVTLGKEKKKGKKKNDIVASLFNSIITVPCAPFERAPPRRSFPGSQKNVPAVFLRLARIRGFENSPGFSDFLGVTRFPVAQTPSDSLPGLRNPWIYESYYGFSVFPGSSSSRSIWIHDPIKFPKSPGRLGFLDFALRMLCFN